MLKNYRFNLILYAMALLFSFGCGGGGNTITEPDPVDIGDNNPDVYVAIGDSITEGRSVPAGDPYPARLAALTGKIIVNEGVAGEQSEGGVARVAGLLELYKPAYLLILYGANDVIFNVSTETTISNLRVIIRSAKANKTEPIIAGLTPQMKSHAVFQGSVDVLNSRIKQLANEEVTTFVDLAAEFNNDPGLLQSDGLHPSDSGAAVIASAFAKALGVS